MLANIVAIMKTVKRGVKMLRLKLLRKSNGLSLDEMSRILNVNKSTLSRIENGLREPKESLIIDCAKYFNVSTDYLLGLVDFSNTKYLKSLSKDILELDLKYLKLAKKMQIDDIPIETIEKMIDTIKSLRK